MPKKSAEILAHIAAPSRASDDTRYRALAQAYLDFEPTSRISLSPVTTRSSDSEAAQLQHAYGSQNVELPIFLSSVELSFGSASDNFRSPRIRAVPTGNPSAEAQNSWQAPPSVVEDSMPDNNLVIAQFCSPTRILEYYLSGFESSQSTSWPHSAGPTQSATSSPSMKIIPRSPTMGLKRNCAAMSAHWPSDNPAVIPSSSNELPAATTSPSVPYPASSNRADSEPPGNKRRRSSPTEEPLQGLGRSTSDIGPRQDQLREQIKSSQAKKLRRSCLSLDGLEIRAPEPPVSCRDIEPSMMVTEQLAKLARDADINRHFIEPRIQSRELRPFERGHWQVDCTGWAMAKRQEIWRFLTNYVGGGEAGWGIWAKRDEPFTFIRLYCWGNVAGHMYLMLYLATKRDILYLGVSWIGSDGRKVIMMPPRKRSSTSAKGKGTFGIGEGSS